MMYSPPPVHPQALPEPSALPPETNVHKFHNEARTLAVKEHPAIRQLSMHAILHQCICRLCQCPLLCHLGGTLTVNAPQPQLLLAGESVLNRCLILQLFLSPHSM